jgi:hypothetical protein
MKRISAFVGHSFLKRDENVVRVFLDYFNDLKNMGLLQWEHAENAEAKVLSEKVRGKMNNKELFIGICTSREFAFDKDKLSREIFGCVIAPRSNVRVKPSDWILQEIGMAFGKGMALMLLVEDGITDVGGLQGDIEYIPFPRESPQSSFSKILQFIHSLAPEGGTSAVEVLMDRSAPLTAPSTESAQKAPLESGAVENPSEWTMSHFLEEQIHAIYSKGAAREAEVMRLFHASEHSKDAYNAVEMKADQILARHVFSKENGFEDLRTLCNENPHHAQAHFCLARLYREFDDHQQAAALEAICSANARNETMRIRSLFRAARDYSQLGDVASRERCIREAAATAAMNSDLRSVYFECRAALAEKHDDDFGFFAFAERALKANPSAADNMRFNLAYRYDERGFDALAFHHGQIRLREEPNDAANANNLAAAADKLGLVGQAGSTFLSAATNGSARAYGNLAFRYLHAGFFDQTEECLASGTKIDATDDRLAAAVSELKQARDKEDEKAKEAAKAARITQRFFLSFADALEGGCPALDGTSWTVATRELSISIVEGEFTASGVYERPAPGALGNALLGLNATDKSDSEQVVVTFKGPIRGATVNAKRTEGVDGRRCGLLNSLLETPTEKDVLLVLSDDAIVMLELGGDNVVTEWIKRTS